MAYKFKITKDEIRKRLGFFLLGFFFFYLADPVRTWMDGLGVNNVLLGISGIILVFYLFEF